MSAEASSTVGLDFLQGQVDLLGVLDVPRHHPQAVRPRGRRVFGRPPVDRHLGRRVPRFHAAAGQKQPGRSTGSGPEDAGYLFVKWPWSRTLRSLFVCDNLEMAS